MADHDDAGVATLTGGRKVATQRKGLNVKVTGPFFASQVSNCMLPLLLMCLHIACMHIHTYIHTFI